MVQIVSCDLTNFSDKLHFVQDTLVGILTLLSSLDDLCLRFSLMSFASLEWLCMYGIGELAELVDMVSELPSTELVLCS